MTEPIDELGPVDYLVVEFPGSQFNGEILPELLALVRHGVVRILDLAVIRKNEDGSYEAFEFEDLQEGPLAELREIERDLAELLSDDDVAATAEALEPGSTAALLIYENLWAAPLASAVRRSGGQLIASGRVPVQQLLAAAEAELAQEIETELEAQALVAEVAAQIEADEEADAGTS
ncbi:DUF6325 family protein [Nakamurella sp.]|uniref:DUF6325 family protein n=1 Tax=Nakamurella sp. TaxID=1869182 RepID=UPI003783EE74